MSESDIVLSVALGVGLAAAVGIPGVPAAARDERRRLHRSSPLERKFRLARHADRARDAERRGGRRNPRVLHPRGRQSPRRDRDTGGRRSGNDRGRCSHDRSAADREVDHRGDCGRRGGGCHEDCHLAATCEIHADDGRVRQRRRLDGRVGWRIARLAAGVARAACSARDRRGVLLARRPLRAPAVPPDAGGTDSRNESRPELPAQSRPARKPVPGVEDRGEPPADLPPSAALVEPSELWRLGPQPPHCSSGYWVCQSTACS